MIFDPAVKQVWHLLRLKHLFPIVHLPRVEWQVPVPVFKSLIVCLEANSFKVYEFHSLTKCASEWSGKIMNMTNTL